MNHRERWTWERGYIARDSAARLRKSSCNIARLSSMPFFIELEIVLAMILLSFWVPCLSLRKGIWQSMCRKKLQSIDRLNIDSNREGLPQKTSCGPKTL